MGAQLGHASLQYSIFSCLRLRGHSVRCRGGHGVHGVLREARSLPMEQRKGVKPTVRGSGLTATLHPDRQTYIPVVPSRSFEMSWLSWNDCKATPDGSDGIGDRSTIDNGISLGTAVPIVYRRGLAGVPWYLPSRSDDYGPESSHAGKKCGGKLSVEN